MELFRWQVLNGNGVYICHHFLKKNPLFFDFQSKKEIFENVLIQELDEFYLFADTRFLFVCLLLLLLACILLNEPTDLLVQIKPVFFFECSTYV